MGCVGLSLVGRYARVSRKASPFTVNNRRTNCGSQLRRIGPSDKVTLKAVVEITGTLFGGDIIPHLPMALEPRSMGSPFPGLRLVSPLVEPPNRDAYLQQHVGNPS